jgi:hypothetical protein
LLERVCAVVASSRPFITANAAIAVARDPYEPSAVEFARLFAEMYRPGHRFHIPFR